MAKAPKPKANGVAPSLQEGLILHSNKQVKTRDNGSILYTTMEEILKPSFPTSYKEALLQVFGDDNAVKES